MNDELDFLYADKHESLLQSDSMILIEMFKHSQSSQNSEFAMSLQYLKKEVKDKVDFFANRSTLKFPKSLFQHFGDQSFLQGWYYH